MEKLYKQFAELVTRFKAILKIDEFFVARFRLTFYYSITAMIILAGSSVVLYNTILSNLAQSVRENVLDPDIYKVVMDRTQDILLNRFLTIDALIIFFVVVLGFFLTQKTLRPIKANMEKQKRFIADASHELRTPIAVAMSGLEVALSNKKLDFFVAKKTLENTLEEMKGFSELSNNLLDISKYDKSICLECVPFDVNELIKSIVEKSRYLVSVKEINLQTKIMNEPVIINGNRLVPKAYSF